MVATFFIFLALAVVFALILFAVLHSGAY